MWKYIRLVLLFICAISVLPVVSEFFVRLAEETGLYSTPIENVRQFMRWFTDSPFFWFVFPFFLGLTIGVWIDYFLKQLKVTIIYPNIPTLVKLQFTSGSINAVQLENKNLNNTLAVRELTTCVDRSQKIIWYVFMTFNKPTHYGQIIVDAGNAAIPDWHVTSHTNYSAVVRFDGDIGNITLTIKTIPPNG